MTSDPEDNRLREIAERVSGDSSDRAQKIFIETATPATVLALLDRIREMEGERDEARGYAASYKAATEEGVAYVCQQANDAEARALAAEGERDELRHEVANLNHHYRCHRENGERLHAQLHEMNAALEPFAKVGRAYADGNANAKHPLLILQGHERVGPVTVGDFLRAADHSLGEPSPEDPQPTEEVRF